MPGKNMKGALLFALSLAFLPACGPESAGQALGESQQPATTCNGYVALTFDDGPTSNTNNLLTLLKNNGLQATLFNIGQNAAGNPSMVRAEVDAGMWVNNHSYTHSHMTSLSQSQMQDELTRTNQVLSANGASPKIFRPPYGETNSNLQAAASAAGLKLVTWDVDSGDWNNASTSAIVSAADRLQNGQIILMHDGYANTNAAIPQIATNLKARGLCPGMIDPSTGRAVAPAGGGNTLTVARAGSGSGTVTSNPSGINCGSTCSASFNSGTSVTLTAQATAGSTFGGWSGACSGSSATCTVTLNGAQTVTATFNPGPPPNGMVSINAGGSATGDFVADAYFSGGSTYSTTSAIDTSLVTGTVPPQAVFQAERYGEFSYTVPGLTAGSPYTVTLYFQESYFTATGQRTFNVAINGSTVLTAFDIFAAAGAANKAIVRSFDTTVDSGGQIAIQFTKGGGPDNPKVCGLTVAPRTGNTLTVTRAGNGNGTVTGGGINCGSTCSASIASGTSVTLTALAASGSAFTGWSGACTGTGTCTVVMNSAQSVTATFSVPTCASAPSAPSGLTATAISATQIQLAWSGVSPPPPCSSLTYSVFRGGTQVASGLTASTFLDTGLSPASSYSYTVRAVDSAGSSPPSNTASATTPALPDTQPPTAPSNLTAPDVGTTTVTLSWSPSTDNAGVTGYDILQGGAPVGSSNITSATVSNLTPGSFYTFTVRARDAAGNLSAPSNPVSVTTVPVQDVTPPTAPANLTWSNVDMTVTLTWGSSTDNVGVLVYDFYYGSYYIGSASGNTATLIGFRAGTPYNFTIKARDAAGNVSEASNQVTVLLSLGQDTTPPTAPTNLASAGVTSNSISLRWTASTDDVGVVVYQVLVNGSLAATVMSPMATVTGLVPGTSYAFTVVALDAAGNVSAPSAPLVLATTN